MMSKTKEHNIFRIGKGWQVKAILQGTQQTRFFSDSKADGKNEALQQAISYRDKLLEERGDFNSGHESYDTRFYYPNGTSRSTTGVPGIYLSKQKGAEGDVYLYFSTTIRIEKGDVINRQRSITKWGFESALGQIAQIRKKWMKKIYPERFDEKQFDHKVEKLKADKRFV